MMLAASVFEIHTDRQQ